MFQKCVCDSLGTCSAHLDIKHTGDSTHHPQCPIDNSTGFCVWVEAEEVQVLLYMFIHVNLIIL